MTTSRDIIIRVAAENGMTPAELTGTLSRHPHIVAARRCAMREIRDTLHLSTTAIGRLFHRKHSTVIYNLKNGQCGTKFVAREGNKHG